MTGQSLAKIVVSASLTALSVSGAWAASQVFYADQQTAVTPQQARDLFLLGSTSLESESFEASPLGFPPAALGLFAGQGSLIQDLLSSGSVKQGTQLNGRFNTTPNCNPVTGCKWWETGESFEITLASKKSTFGFYATDLGDAGGAISLDFWNDATKVRSGISVIQPTQTSGLLFFGWVDDTFTFNRVTFNVTQTAQSFSDYDFIGFDDLLAGVRATTPNPNPNPVSAPASLSLVALSLGLLAATRQRRKPGARAS